MELSSRQSIRIRRHIQEPAKDTPLLQDPKQPDESENEGQSTGSTTRKRRKTKSKAKHTANVDISLKFSSEVARPDRRNVRGRRGLLHCMYEMPLDITYEVFGQLEPIDLLQLSWACKSLHEIVMSKQARFLWINAFKAKYSQSGGPPPCPADLNLAQYARFLYVKRCMICQTSNASYSSWGLRLKTCLKCLQTDRFVINDSYPGIARDIHTILAKGKIYCLANEEMLHLDRRSPRYDELSKDFEKKSEDNTAYLRWKSHVDLDRRKDLLKMRNARQEQLFEKLAEIGWSKADILKYKRHIPLVNLPTFGKSPKLTNGEWDKIHPLIITTLEKWKEDWTRNRIFYNWLDLDNIFSRWKYQLNPDLWFRARSSEFLVHEPFKSAIMNYDMPPQLVLDEEMASTLTRINDECFRKRNETLFALLPGDLKQMSAVMDDPYQILHLATIWFQDTTTAVDQMYDSDGMDAALWAGTEHAIAMDYPTVLMNTKIAGRLRYRADELDVVKQIGEHRPWELDSARFAFGQKSHELAKELVAACGKDPNTATRADMNSDELKVTILCKSCFDSQMPWSEVVQHMLKVHPNYTTWDSVLRVRDAPQSPDPFSDLDF